MISFLFLGEPITQLDEDGAGVNENAGKSDNEDDLINGNDPADNEPKESSHNRQKSAQRMLFFKQILLLIKICNMGLIKKK